MHLLTKSAVVALALAPAVGAQQARDQIRLDDPNLANTPDGFDIVIDGEGMLRAAMWVDERDPANTFDDAIFGAVSTDRGVTWGPEFVIFDDTASATDIDDAKLTVEDGILFVSFDEDSTGSTTPTAQVLRSTDNGATWTNVLSVFDAQNPEVHADGTNVCVLYYDASGTTDILNGAWSTDNGATFAAGQPISLGDVDSDGWTGQVIGDTAYAVWFDDSVTAGDNDLWFSMSVAGAAWSAPVRVDQDTTGLGDVDTRPKMRVTGGNIYVAYNEDGRNGGTTSDDEVYFCVSSDGGATWTETMISPIAPVDADYMEMDAEGSTVAIIWNDDRLADEPARIVVSNDGGATFGAEYVVPNSGGGGPYDHQQHNIFIDGGRIVAAFEDDTWNANSIDELPAFVYSSDAGASFAGPFLMGSGFEADEDIDTEGTAWFYDEGSLSGMWQTDGGTANPDAIFVGGIRFPFIGIADNGNGTVTFSLGGADTTVAQPSYACWAASTVTGVSAHPDNAAETLGLGASFALNYTLSRRQQFAAAIQPDGSASLDFGVGNLSGTYYIQGWVNIGPSTTGGTTTSDVVEITL